MKWYMTKKVAKKKKKDVCLERSQLAMLFDVIRKKRKCNAATEFIERIDAEFEPVKKKKKVTRKKRKSWLEEWL